MNFGPAESADLFRTSDEPVGGASPAVSSYAGHGFEKYVRVLNPAVLGAHLGHERRRSWRSLAEPFQKFDGSTAQWVEVRASMFDATAFGEPTMGRVEDATACALVEVLARHTTTPGECLFAWWVGYADARVPAEAPRTLLPPAREVFLMQGAVSDGAREHADWGIGRTPMRWLPRDRAWSVGNDIYGRSVYIGGTDVAMRELLEHPELEAYVVDVDTPVMPEDW